MLTPDLTQHPALEGLAVFERGWLSSNNVLVQDRTAGATLIDSSHVLHAPQTLALVDRSLADTGTLTRVVNTHLHSDHCGGNAALQRRWGCEVWIGPGQWASVQAWDDEALSYLPTGQQCERFTATHLLEPGSVLHTGSRRWEVLAAPGHDPHSLMLLDAERGVLISADALWERGFGVVFPELSGEEAFGDVERVLDLIATLPVQVVIPGHGAPFTDVSGALERARQRLATFRQAPVRHFRYAAKALITYHLMEVQSQPRAELLHWFAHTPLLRDSHQRFHSGEPAELWCTQVLDELLTQGVLHDDGGRVRTA